MLLIIYNNIAYGFVKMVDSYVNCQTLFLKSRPQQLARGSEQTKYAATNLDCSFCYCTHITFMQNWTFPI